MKYFGTDGIRQKAEKFTPEFLESVVIGLAEYAGTNKKVLIGGDTRESSERILQDLAAILETLEFEYASVGVLPTPAINYCFYKMGFDFAIDVTASHNPYVDNGIKIFERGENGGVKLGASGCEMIEKSLVENRRLTGDKKVGAVLNLHDEAVELYVKHLKEYVGEADFLGLELGMDCANGAMSVIGERVFKELGANVWVINAESGYGRKINDGCGSTHLEDLQKMVVQQSLDFGVAYDGDGDRCLLVDSSGKVVDGDEIIVILAECLGLSAVAVTVMANQGLLNWADKNGIRAEVTAVGDANVAVAMKEHNIMIGGEQSGHIILPGEPTGDGMLTSLMVTQSIRNNGKTLRELANSMQKMPQINVTVVADATGKAKLTADLDVKTVISEFENMIKKMGGRLLVRPSGTEDLIRITVWGDNETDIEKIANELKNKLGEIL